jgi:hypothetical protein
VGYSSAPSYNAVATQRVPLFCLARRQSATRVQRDKGGVPSTGCMAVERDHAAQPSELAHWHPMLLHHHPDADIFLCNNHRYLLAMFQLMMLTTYAALLTRNALLRE